MTHLLGIDLGTSSVKVVLVAFDGTISAVASETYPIDTPQPAYAEQDPHQWWNRVTHAVKAVMQQAGHPPVHAIGLAGQMHGTVLVDQSGQPLHPAIIWADQRSETEVEDFINRISRDDLERITGTLPAVGFMGPTLLWLNRHRPDLLQQVHRALLPKDYLRYRLVERFATEPSDASATALFDIWQRSWSWDVLHQLELPTDIFPDVIESADVAGELTQQAAAELGLQPGIPVIAGCADQTAQAITAGLLHEESASVTIGTGAQYFQPLASPHVFANLHTFCHVLPRRWYVLGAMLSAGLSLRWLRDLLNVKTFSQLEADARRTKPGAGGLIFLPYLVGERAPIRDAAARGAFVGLTLRHESGHLARAVMEGVAFSLRQILELVASHYTIPDALIASGNGLRSDVWRQITADVLQRPLHLKSDTEQTALGAAFLAGFGTGVYDKLNHVRQIQSSSQPVFTTPQLDTIKRYDTQYEAYKACYPELVHTMHRLQIPE